MPKKILIIRSSSMGDIVHALPVAYDIKKAFPDSQLHWVVEESFRDIPQLSPFVDQCVVTAFRRWRKTWWAAQTREQVGQLRHRLRAEKYDLVIDLQGLVRSALVARWSGAHSIGYSRQCIREPLASLLYSETKTVPESLRPVRRYRTMAAQCLGYPIDEQHPHFGLLATAPRPCHIRGPYVALAVNTSRCEKLWAQCRWIETARELRDQGYLSVLFWASQEERDRVQEIANVVDGAIVAPRSSLAELASLIQGADAMIGVDTGLAHLAAALAVPSVGIIVGTSADLFSLVSEGACSTVGDQGVVPSVQDVLRAFNEVVKRC